MLERVSSGAGAAGASGAAWLKPAGVHSRFRGGGDAVLGRNDGAVPYSAERSLYAAETRSTNSLPTSELRYRLYEPPSRKLGKRSHIWRQHRLILDRVLGLRTRIRLPFEVSLSIAYK